MAGLNNRELAVVFWLLLFILVGLRASAARKSLTGLVRAFLNRQILGGVLAMLLYTAGIVYVLYAVGIWKFALIKDTVVWFCFTAFVLGGSAVTRTETGMVKEVAKESLKIILIFEFLVNEYTFSLPVELLLVPAMTFIVLLDVMARRDESTAPITKITGGIQVLAGLFLIINAIRRAVEGFDQLATVDAIRKVLLAPVMTLMFIPLLFLAMLYSAYEQLFTLLKVGRPKQELITRYAKRQLIAEFGMNIAALQRFRRANAWDLSRVQTESDVDAVLQAWRIVDRERLRPLQHLF